MICDEYAAQRQMAIAIAVEIPIAIAIAVAIDMAIAIFFRSNRQHWKFFPGLNHDNFFLPFLMQTLISIPVH